MLTLGRILVLVSLTHYQCANASTRTRITYMRSQGNKIAENVDKGARPIL
jgi:hypothetical protein